MSETETVPNHKSGLVVLWWLMPLALIWGVIAFGAFPFVHALRCFSEGEFKDVNACDLALKEYYAKGIFKAGLLRRQANLLYADGKLDEALEATRKVQGMNLAEAVDYSMEGQIHTDQGNTKDAVVAYRKAFDLNPEDEDAFVNALKALHSDLSYDEARSFGKTYLKAHPESVLGHSWHGWTSFLDGKYAEAEPDLRFAAEHDPENAFRWQELARNSQGAGKLEDAEVQFGKAVALDNANTDFINALAQVQCDNYKRAACTATFLSSLKVIRGQDAVTGLAHSYLDQSKTDLARPLVQEALTTWPNQNSILDLKVRLDYVAEDYEEAKRSIDALKKEFPESEDAIYWTASIDDIQGRSEEALKGYSSLLTSWNKDAGLRIDVGHVLVDLERYDEALKIFDEAMALNPRRATVYSGKSRVYARLKQWAESKLAAEKSLAIDGSNGIAFARRAWAEWNLKEFDDGLRDYELALEREPNVDWIRIDQIKALIEVKKLELAKTALADFANRFPKSGELANLRQELADAVAPE